MVTIQNDRKRVVVNQLVRYNVPIRDNLHYNSHYSPNVCDMTFISSQIYQGHTDILLTSTFTRGKTLTFLNMQKLCAEVDAHNKCITFIRRSCQIINIFRRTPSESQRTDQNSSFLVCWTRVSVCVTGPSIVFTFY